jgi:hypothetical protein
MEPSIDWRAEIIKLVVLKNTLTEVDKEGVFPQHLPKAPATPGEIQECERALGFELDDEYRTFLLHADGWHGFVQDIHLFGTQDLLGSDRFCEARRILQSYRHVISGSDALAIESLFPIGVSLADGDVFAMVRPGIPSDWRVFWIAGGESERYPSFSEFFLTMMDANFEEIASFRQDAT